MPQGGMRHGQSQKVGKGVVVKFGVGKKRQDGPLGKPLVKPKLLTTAQVAKSASSFGDNIKNLVAGGDVLKDVGNPPPGRDRKKQHHAFAFQSPEKERVTGAFKFEDIVQNSSSKARRLKEFYQGNKMSDLSNSDFHKFKSKTLRPDAYVVRSTPPAGKNSSRQMSAAKHGPPVLQLTNSSEPPIISPSDPRHQNLRASVTKPNKWPPTVSQGNFYGNSSGNGSSSSRPSAFASSQFRSPRQTPLPKADKKVKRPSEPIDLTCDSDDSPSPSQKKKQSRGGQGDGPSRRDVVDLTGKDTTGVDGDDVIVKETSFDASIFKADKSQRDPNKPYCTFILKAGVGTDKSVMEVAKGDDDDDDDEEEEEEIIDASTFMSWVQAKGLGTYALTASDLKCLTEPEWLNDEVINSYLCLLLMRSRMGLDGEAEKGAEEGGGSDKDGSEEEEEVEQGTKIDLSVSDDETVEEESDSEEPKPPNEHPKNHFFSSFWYAILRNAKGGYSYENVKRWSRRLDLSTYDNIFLPINVNNVHWCMAVIRPKAKQLLYLDSLNGESPYCLKLLERFLNDEGKARGIKALTGVWEKIQVSPTSHFKIPAQTDACSCGLFALAFADCLSRGFKLEELRKLFMQKDMGDIRSYVLETLLRCRMKG